MSPALTVVLPVFGRPRELAACLEALAGQAGAPPFEVVVVDDGSPQPVEVELPVTGQVIRQAHAGIAAARNRGLALATGDLVVFLDSDVLAGAGFLAALAAAARGHPEANLFQARLTSGTDRLSWRVEGARLAATQLVLLTDDGRIRYANTSALAVRTRYARAHTPFFDPALRRGEDTLVLARAAASGELPQYVPEAVAEHRPPAPLPRYLARHLAIGYHDAAARAAAAGAGVLLAGEGRLRMLRELARRCGPRRVRFLVLLLALTAYALEVTGRLAGRQRASAS